MNGCPAALGEGRGGRAAVETEKYKEVKTTENCTLDVQTELCFFSFFLQNANTFLVAGAAVGVPIFALKRDARFVRG